MVNQLNQYVTAELAERFEGMGHCIVLNYEGLAAEEAVGLRALLRERGIALRVVKNRLARIALEQVGLTALRDMLQGQCAIVSGGEDMPTVAKVLTDWIKQSRKLAVRGGYADGQALDQAGVQTMADIPPRPVLLAMFAGALLAAPRQVALAFQAIQASLARALDEIRKQKEPAGDDSPAAEDA